MKKPLDVTIVGGGMITNDLLLPSVYHLQRSGIAGKISVCALNSPPLCALRDNPDLQTAFPGRTFTPWPDFDEAPDNAQPELYKKALSAMRPRQAVIVAMPDHLHYEVIMEALRNDQHVLCVKPLVLEHRQAVEIGKIAYEKGLFVGVEYHKRFDRRSLMARRRYELGHFGRFVLGEAKLIEPYFYRHSNFQNWFTVEATDPFVYIGCHYVDLVYFITGLRPVEVSVAGIKGKFPNGNEGFLWAQGRVRFENDALLSVVNGLGYPDQGAGSNDQALLMYCEGDNCTGMIKHDDQFRGVTHSYLEGMGCAGSHHNFVNPDFYRLVPWEGEGYRPIGYGYDSVAASLQTMFKIESETTDLAPDEQLEARRAQIRAVDERGIIATPANSAINELVVEAARLSILSDGATARIVEDPEPHAELKSAQHR